MKSFEILNSSIFMLLDRNYLIFGIIFCISLLPLLPVIIFIIFFVSSNCLMSLFTSCTEVPLPNAIRFRREPFSMIGFARSSGVIERIIASTPLNASSSMSIFFNALPIPGIIEAKSFRLPIFLIC